MDNEFLPDLYELEDENGNKPVSYTHLTLPTNSRV